MAMVSDGLRWTALADFCYTFATRNGQPRFGLRPKATRSMIRGEVRVCSPKSRVPGGLSLCLRLRSPSLRRSHRRSPAD